MKTFRKIRKHFMISFLVVGLLSNTMPLSSVVAEEADKYLQESLAELQNPERGFYEPVGYELKVSGNEILDLHDNLIHLRVGISAFSKAANGSGDLPFSQDMLDALDETLKNVKKNGGSVILRFAYDDFDGIADLEPSMDMMLVHIGQLKAVFEENADVISYVELGLFGPWGEMHTSKMCTTENVSIALDGMLQAVPKEITVGVRTPYYYATWAKVERSLLHLDMPQEGSDAYRVGLYNDGYLGSESDLGTFDNREIETTWLSNQARHTFYGGEVVANRAEGEPLNTVAYLSKEAFKTHTTYLNLYWNDAVIDSWKEEVYQGEDLRYQGQSGFTYVTNHLGYRYVLRQCKLDDQIHKGQNFPLNLKIENVGFANLINRKVVSIIFEGQNSTYEVRTDLDARTWESAQVTSIQKEIVLPENMEAGEYKVYLRVSKYGEYLTDQNYQCIQFANEGIWNEEIGANEIGSIRVLEEETGNTPDEPGGSTGETGGSTDEPGGSTGETGSSPDEPGGSTGEAGGGPDEPAGGTPEQPGGIQENQGDTSNTPTKDKKESILVKEIVLTGMSNKIAAGKKIQLKAIVLPSNATNQTLKWTSSNSNYATVSKDGLVKVKKAGAGHRVTIQAVSTDGSQVVAKYKITIMKKAVKKLTVQVPKKSVKAGKKMRIKATVFPAKKVNGKLLYTTSHAKYATVNKNGVIKTKKAGKGKTVRIYISTTDGSNLKKTIKVRIK